MIGVDTFGSVFGGAPAHTAEHLTEHVRAIIRAGWSPVLLKPMSKEPVCILSSAQAKRADKDAQARILASNPSARIDRIRHACGFAHVLDDPGKVAAIVKRLTELHGGLNVGLHLGRSRLLAVDVDTPDERAAFERAWTEPLWMRDKTDAELRGAPRGAPGITVESPGSYDQAAQRWKHFGGGHWVFELAEDDELPPGKVFKGPGGWAAMWGESYILTPPSARPEGAYRLVGGTNPRPAWLWEQIQAAGAQRQQTERERTGMIGGPIDAWSATASWSSLLAPRGWTETSMVEGSCGCPVWTGPGDHASPKSATAHDISCARFDVAEGWGPLKIWTDHPPEPLPPEGTVTKLQFVALMDHGGDDGAACRALGIERQQADAFPVDPEWAGQSRGTVGERSPATFSPVQAEATGNGWGTVTDLFSDPGVAPDPSVPQAAVADAGETEGPSWGFKDLTPFLNGSYTPPAPALLVRSDGLPLLYPGLTHSIHGESESGKSWIAQIEAARCIQAGLHVAYIDFESDAGTVVSRLLILGCTPEQIQHGFHYAAPEFKPGSTEEEYTAWLTLFAGRYALAVIDGVTDALGLWGLKSTDNDDYSSFARNFPRRLASQTGAAVLLVDHVTKSVEGRGRFAIGGQAKMNSLSGAAYVVDVIEHMGIGVRGVLALGLAKDRAGGLRGRLGTAMDKHRIQPAAEIIIDSTGPQMLVAINPPAVPETERGDELADRVRSWLTDYSGQSLRQILDGVGGKRDDVIAVTRQLISSGEVVVEKIGQKHAHSLITSGVPYDSGTLTPPYVV